MSRLRPLLLLLLLCGFLFRWESEQVLMWANMLRNAAPSQSLASALDDALSGTKPCPNCLRLTAQKTTADASDSSIVSPEPPPQHLLPCETAQLPQLSCHCCLYFSTLTFPRNPPAPLPLLPPPKVNS
jgi:hypothetical protein